MALRGSDEDIRFVIRAIDDGGFRLLAAYQKKLAQIRRDEADFARSGQLRDERGRFMSRDASRRVIEAKKLRLEQNAAHKEQEQRINREQRLLAEADRARRAGIQRINRAWREAYAEEARRQKGLNAQNTDYQQSRIRFISRVRKAERDAYAEDERINRRRQTSIQRMGRLHAQALAEDARRTRARGALPGGNTPGEFGTEMALWGRLRNAVLSFYAARAAVRAISGFVQEGMNFNQLIETATLGVATIITASSELRDSEGKAIKGAQALEGAYALAEDQLQKIRIAGLQTAATTEQLAEAFQQATGPGLAAGLNLDQIRKITIQIVQAAGAIGVPFNQLNQEVRSILAATIDRNSRIAKTLLITNEQVKQAQQQNRLAEFLNEKLEAFSVAGKRAADTMFVIKSNLKETLQVFAGTSTRALFEGLKKTLQDTLLGTFDFVTLQISDKFQGILGSLDSLFGTVGTIFGTLLKGAVEGAADLSRWLKTNKAQVDLIVESFVAMIVATGRIIRDSALFLANLVGAGAQSGTIVAVLDNITEILDFINRNAKLLLGTFIAIKLATFAMSDAFVAFLFAIQRHPAIAILSAIAGLLVVLSVRLSSAAAAQRAFTRAQNDHNIAIAKTAPNQLRLIKQYEDLHQQLSGLKEGTDEYAGVQDQIADVTRELIRINPKFNDLLNNERLSRRDVVDEMIRETTERRKAVQGMLNEAKAKVDVARANLKLAESSIINRFIQFASFGMTPPQIARAKKSLDDARSVVADFQKILDEFDKEASTPAGRRLTPFRPAPVVDDKKGKAKAISDLQEANRKRIEVIRSDIEKRKALLEEDVADEVITREVFNQQMAALITEQKNREISSWETLRSDLKRIKALEKQDSVSINAEIEVATNEHIERLADLRRRAARERLKDAKAAAKEQTAAAAQAVLDAQQAIKDANEQVTAQIGRGEISKAEGSAIVAKVIEAERAKVQVALESLRELRSFLTAPLPAGTDEGTLGAFKKLGEAVLPTLDRQITNTEGVLTNMTNAMNKAHLAANAFEIEIGKILSTGITSFFNDIVQQTKSVGEAFRDMALSIVNSIASIIAQTVAWQLVNSILPGAAGVKPAAAGFLSGKGPTLSAATGGYVQGPGTSTSDSIAARLSAGEYVLRADKVRDIGVDVLDAINFGRSSHRVRGRGSFATGGLVEAAGGGGGGIAALRVGLDRGLVLQVLKSPEAGKVMVRHAARNRNKLRQVVR